MATQLFHSLSFRDADAGIAFLTALGFVTREVHRDPDDDTVVVHAELTWRETGGVMCGTDRGRTEGWTDSVGRSRCYCVVESDADVDRVHAAALAAGGTSVQAPSDADYGGRTCAVADAEGNQWSFGSYGGATGA